MPPRTPRSRWPNRPACGESCRACPGRGCRGRSTAHGRDLRPRRPRWRGPAAHSRPGESRRGCRSEEHTSELQSRRDLVCRLLLEKKKKNKKYPLPNKKKKKKTKKEK